MVVEHIKQHGARFTASQVAKIIIFIVVFGLAVGLLSAFLNNYIDPQSNRYVQYLLSHESYLIGIYLAYVVVASVTIIVPTLPFDLLMLGTLTSPWIVIGYRLFGGIIGSAINFYLARKYGRSLLRRWLSQKNYDFIDKVANNLTLQQFIIVTMIPVINAELMAYAGGLSRVKFRWSMLTLALAIFYRVVFVYFVMSAGR